MHNKILAKRSLLFLVVLVASAMPAVSYAGGTIPPPDGLPTTGAGVASLAQSLSTVAAVIAALGASVWFSRRRQS